MIKKITEILTQGFRVLQHKNARILAYHSIQDDLVDPWTISPQRLSAHLQILNERNFRICSLPDLIGTFERGEDVTDLVCLTFDDGFADFKTSALPVLQKGNTPATIYVPTGKIGGTSDWSTYGPYRPLLTWNDLNDIRINNAEITIGNHSWNHKHLTTLGDDELAVEVTNSYAELAANLGIIDQHFAYPYGECGHRERRIVEKAGYKSAVLFSGLWGNKPSSDILMLARSPMLARHSLVDFIHIIEGWEDFQQIEGSLRRRISSTLRPATQSRPS